MTSLSLPIDAKIVVGAFVASGTVHLVRPEAFEPLMPDVVPAHREVIYASGVAELLCAAGMLHPRTRRIAGLASAAVLVGVLPGNIKMALDALKTRNQTYKAISLARLPLQLPMIRAALKVARQA
jgi:uncharacterized membrane protein